ncbi:hypothetical protein [Kitasatospora phosalacinea]|uniref:hypothetical protein n=1 Tax=Kitasatospora phosalacinea TaxID=2065 RepID=UPI002554E934|nr:hypothetical protein [Kitasatospora phosalacinea]
MSAHAALVLVGAVVVGIVVGVLTFFGGGPAAAAVLAGLTAFGAATVALHKLIA